MYLNLAPNRLTAFEMPGDQQLYAVELEDVRDYKPLENRTIDRRFKPRRLLGICGNVLVGEYRPLLAGRP